MSFVRFFIFLMLTTGTVWAGKTVDLIIVAGQSNAVGFDAHAPELPKSSYDKNIMFWWKCGAPPADESDSSSNHEWTTLQTQPKGVVKPGQTGNFRDPKGGFGSEINLARTLYKHNPKQKLAVIKVAYNATCVDQWNPKQKKSLYNVMMTEVKLAMEKAKKKGITLRPRLFVWIQGESDSFEAKVPTYKKKLSAMFKALKKDLKSPNLAILMGFNTTAWLKKPRDKYAKQIEAIQKDIGKSSKEIEYVDLSKCKKANLIHFSSEGNLEVGKLLAETLLKIEKKH